MDSTISTFSRPVIMHSRMQNSAFSRYLPFPNIKFSDAITMDVLVPSAVPSLAFSIFDHRSGGEDSILRIANTINEVQRCQRNYFAFVCNIDDDANWMHLQSLVDAGGSARLLRPPSAIEAASWLFECVTKMCDTEKLKLQSEFFRMEQKRNLTGKMARLIAQSTLTKLRVASEEQQLLMEGFPKLGLLMQADRAMLEERSPVDISTISQVHAFFSCLQPTSQ